MSGTILFRGPSGIILATNGPSIIEKQFSKDKRTIEIYNHKLFAKNTLHWLLFSCCTEHDNLMKLFGPYITGSYITIQVGICVLSLVVQIIILNMYHTQGSRPVPGCLLTIAKRHRGCKRVAVTGNDTTRQDNASEISLNDLGHHKVSPTLHDNREHTGKMSSDTASDLVKEDWRYIARVCDAVCFLLFLVVHIILTIGVVSVLLN